MQNPWDAQAYDTTFSFVSRYGDELLDLLDPQPGERVLDLGCGTGRHAAEIQQRGAEVVGLDLDAEMLAQARAQHPLVDFVAADATAFDLATLGREDEFDACFSNAALHWMTPQDRVLANVRAVIRGGGRFIAEMGGRDNIARLDAALRGALADVGLAITVPENYFPTVGEQASALEHAGFRVEEARWFPRPTALSPGSTAADWTRHFRAMVWAEVPAGAASSLAAQIDARAAELGLLRDGTWFADYCRLRFLARVPT